MASVMVGRRPNSDEPAAGRLAARKHVCDVKGPRLDKSIVFFFSESSSSSWTVDRSAAQVTRNSHGEQSTQLVIVLLLCWYLVPPHPWSSSVRVP